MHTTYSVKSLAIRKVYASCERIKYPNNENPRMILPFNGLFWVDWFDDGRMPNIAYRFRTNFCYKKFKCTTCTMSVQWTTESYCILNWIPFFIYFIQLDEFLISKLFENIQEYIENFTSLWLQVAIFQGTKATDFIYSSMIFTALQTN